MEGNQDNMSGDEHDDLEDRIKKFHGLKEEIQQISRDGSSRDLRTLLDKEVSDYYHANQKEGKVTFKDEGELRKLSDSLWEKSADHVAKTYLKLSSDTIEGLKKGKSGEDGKKPWEEFMSLYLGHTKESLFDSLKSHEHLSLENKEDYIKALHGNYVTIRTSKLLSKHVKDQKDYDAIHKYAEHLKKSLPETFEGYKPQLPKGREEAQRMLVDLYGKVPEGYKFHRGHGQESGGHH